MRRRPLPFLILSFITLISLITLITLVPPDVTLFSLSGVEGLQISTLYLMFIIIFLFLFFLCSYLFKSKKHGVLIACFTVAYLLFRYNDLTHPFFLILLAALFLTVELLVSYRK